MIKNFVFTSAGDNTDFHTLWFNGVINYDVYVIYYGDKDENYELYKSKAKFIERRKGSKFQNFLYFFNKYPDIIEKYDRFFIVDDDIIMSATDITKLFVVAEAFGTKICQPSLSRESKISHAVTRNISNSFLHYTNFIEVNVPLFSKEALYTFMPYMDDKLIGWGIDFLYIYVNGCELNMPLEGCNKFYAIIDSVICTNPFEKVKKEDRRELYKIDGVLTRQKTWEDYAKSKNIPISFQVKTYTIMYTTHSKTPVM
jgi:hypothetical protein